MTRREEWAVTELNGKMVLLTEDDDGTKVAKYVRPKFAEPHPDRAATTNHPTRVGMRVDWIWLPILLLLFACLVPTLLAP